MTRLAVIYEGGESEATVGELLSESRRIYFEYNDTFRASRIELSPFKLPLSTLGAIEEREQTYSGLHGLFNDSLPDGWGMLVMDRALRQSGVDTARITPVDRLAFLGRRTMGALTYRPSTGDDEETLEVDLQAVSEQAQRVLEGSLEQLLPQIVLAGGSPAGARPKILAGVSPDFGKIITGTAEIPQGYAHWLIKFFAREDPPDMGAVEMTYSVMARAAGVTVPATHLFDGGKGKRYFGVQRFDRDPSQPSRRIHTHTLAGLLHHDHRIPGQDYADLMRVVRVLTKNHEDVKEAFRRMVFNILANNRDDHTKNFAFQMDAGGEWRLAPAYDLTFSRGPAGEHTLTVAGEGLQPSQAHIEEIAAGASLESREATEAIRTVREGVSGWRMLAAKHGVLKETIDLVQERMNAVESGLDSGLTKRSREARPGRRRK